ncbi:hypothetical protein [Acidiferrobacter sp.]|jgi:hypothetical protein|uniref:hypothetical protein n=1 Tax=Acidiferrobacter sp. TaxID=1872107 RepID=UPI002639F4C9|nr:hypothetical protein [Acidiferrobacter sp.]
MNRDDVSIVAACFIEDHAEALKEWLAKKGLSYECGMRDWLRLQQRRHYDALLVAAAALEPRGGCANYPIIEHASHQDPRLVQEMAEKARSLSQK